MKPSAADTEPIKHNYVEIGTVYFWDETGSFSAEPEWPKPVRGTAQAATSLTPKVTPALLAGLARPTSTDESRRPR
jgi:hypothetical protein